MTEKKKAKEMLKWLNLFDLLRCKVDQYAINNKTFNVGLKEEIEKLRIECKKLI
jgi:hypothetical protein